MSVVTYHEHMLNGTVIYLILQNRSNEIGNKKIIKAEQANPSGTKQEQTDPMYIKQEHTGAVSSNKSTLIPTGTSNRSRECDRSLRERDRESWTVCSSQLSTQHDTSPPRAMVSFCQFASVNTNTIRFQYSM